MQHYRQHEFWVELGEYAGGGQSGAWCSGTDRQFVTTVQAPSPSVAENMIMAQYGGPDRCRVSFRGYKD